MLNLDLEETHILLKVLRDKSNCGYAEVRHQLRIFKVNEVKDLLLSYSLESWDKWLKDMRLYDNDSTLVKCQDFVESEEEFLLNAAIESCYPDIVLEVEFNDDNDEYGYRLTAIRAFDPSLQLT